MELALSTFPLWRLMAMLGVFVGLMATCVVVGVAASPTVLEGHTVAFGPREERWEAGVNVSALNQALFVGVVVETTRMDATAIKEVEAEVAVWGRDGESEWKEVARRVENLRLVCHEGDDACEPVQVASVAFLVHGEYRVSVERTRLGPVWLTGARMEFEVVNAQFTLFEMYCRAALLAMNVGVGVFFVVSLRSFPFAEWALEQKWTLLLLCCLVGLNDPLFWLSLRWAIFDALDQLLMTGFLSVLMLYWLVMFDSLRLPNPNDRSFKQFFAPKLALMGSFWIALLTVFLGAELLAFSHPLVIVALAIQLLLTVLYVLWLGYIVVKLFPQLRVQLRVLFFFCFTSGVIVLTVAGILFGLLGPLGGSALEFLAFFGLFNFYTFALAFSYYPAKTQRGLEIISIGGGSEGEDFAASDLELSSSSSSNDFEISLSDVGMAPKQQLDDNDLEIGLAD